MKRRLCPADCLTRHSVSVLYARLHRFTWDSDLSVAVMTMTMLMKIIGMRRMMESCVWKMGDEGRGGGGDADDGDCAGGSGFESCGD